MQLTKGAHQTAVSQRARHRHFVAAPLTVLAVALSFLPGGARHQASVLQGDVLRLPGGARIVREAGGIVSTAERAEDTARLEEGNALVEALGFVALDAGSFRVTGVAGAFHLSLRDGSLTVAALTTPVFVEAQGGGGVLIPAGFQEMWDDGRIVSVADGLQTWRSARSFSVLPLRFVERELRVLQDLPDLSPDDVLPTRGGAALATPSWLSALALPAWEADLASERVTHVLRSVREAAESADPAALRALLDESGIEATLRTPEGVRGLTLILAAADAVALPIVDVLCEDEAHCAILSLHPRFRDGAWATSTPERSRRFHLERLFALPVADAAGEAVSPFVWERWQADAIDLLRADGEGRTILELLVWESLARVTQAEETGYPERARRLKAALDRVVAALDAPVHLRESVTAASRALSRTPVPPQIAPPLPPPTASPSPDVRASEQGEEAEAPPSVPPHELLARTDALLREAGALFTVETAIEPQENGTVSVRGIVFPGTVSDYSYDFTFAPKTMEVETIVRDSKVYPYALAWEDFVSWTKK